MEIRLDRIAKSFDKRRVIQPTTLTIRNGSFTTLLGPSGCGKTTLLRMIAGLETPDEGEIWPAGATKDLQSRVRDALRTVHLEDFEKRCPHQLSGGQQQRVAFARAIAVQPRCILFDEPLSALDALLREEMRHELTELTSALGITSVFVTHDQTEAMSMSDRIAVLSGGRVEQYDAPETVYHHPATEFVARFVGKSNWLSETEMFRPEVASSVLKEGALRYELPVQSVQYSAKAILVFRVPEASRQEETAEAE